MKHRLWRRAEEVFHAALERAPDVRRAFLDQACAQDTELRKLVDRLISNDKESGSFLEKPAIERVASTFGDSSRPAGSTAHIGSFPSSVPGHGRGVPGARYSAGPQCRHQDVASELARDPGRLARLRREARMLAALNHPNIAAIYGLESSAEADYLVLELVEGEPLRGPVSLPVALDIAGQVAEACKRRTNAGSSTATSSPAT